MVEVMEGAVTGVLVGIVLGMVSLVMALEVAVSAVDGTEAVTGADVAPIPITRIEDMLIPTSAFIHTTIRITLTAIGLLNVIPMECATGSGSRTIIEGKEKSRMPI